jgi:hypothetical protein
VGACDLRSLNPKPFALRSERLGVSPSQASMNGPDFHPGIAEPLLLERQQAAKRASSIGGMVNRSDFQQQLNAVQNPV